MAFTYTRSNLKSRINAGIQGKQDVMVDFNETVNETVREVLQLVDVRSTRRRAQITPNLFSGINEYAAPSDLKAYGIIDLPAQAKNNSAEFFLVPTEEFRRKKENGSVAVADYNGIRQLLLSFQVNDNNLTIAELDSLTSNGTWSAFGDAENLVADSDDYIKGAGSISFDISSAGGTTAGIQNSTLNNIDLTDYLGGNGAIFVYAKINSATDLTNYILRIGTDSSNYYSKTITVAHDGTAFVNGWNLLRFDLKSLTETGTVTVATNTYISLYMTKATGKISETDYKFDWIGLKKGEIFNLDYYSIYGWQDATTSAYKANSENDSDIIVAGQDEFNLFIVEGRVKAAYEVGMLPAEIQALEKLRDDTFLSYLSQNPSETKIMTNNYFNFIK